MRSEKRTGGSSAGVIVGPAALLVDDQVLFLTARPRARTSTIMNSSTLLSSRASKGRPVRAALIGAGKFGSMILSQIPRIDGLHMAVVVDLDVGLARQSFERVGRADGRYDARSAGEANENGTTFITDDLQAMLACQEIECVIEATGHPLAGTRHALACIEHGKRVVMVNVEADVMVGPILAEGLARKASSIRWPTETSRP